jgi:hypothetical protein
MRADGIHQSHQRGKLGQMKNKCSRARLLQSFAVRPSGQGHHFHLAKRRSLWKAAAAWHLYRSSRPISVTITDRFSILAAAPLSAVQRERKR